jgi:hypothetical protein
MAFTILGFNYGLQVAGSDTGLLPVLKDVRLGDVPSLALLDSVVVACAGSKLGLVTAADSFEALEVRHAARIENGGAESSLSFWFLIQVFEEVSYEVLGGMSGSYTGLPATDVQIVTSVQLHDSFADTVVYFEQDNSLNVSPVSFVYDGVDAGNVAGGGPGTGRRTGVLQPGAYSVAGISSVFSRGVGFSATADSEIELRLTPTDS